VCFKIQSNSRVIEIGHTAILQCKASGDPLPKVFWLKDMKRVEISSRYTIIDGLYIESNYIFG
jgi:receptor-type tyrosine-protein phosphatase F